MVKKSVIQMWSKYKEREGIEGGNYTSWYFGNKDIADRLGELVVNGVKKATTGLKFLYDESKDGEKIPRVGDTSVVTNYDGEALCVIKVIKVVVCKFHEVTEEFAYIEGEGDKSLEYWRSAHILFFENELKEYGVRFNEDMEVVLEYFKVVYK